MKGIQRCVRFGRSVLLISGVAVLAAAASAPVRAQSEVARNKPAEQSSRSGYSKGSTTADDARGAVDGHTPNGGFHFHTETQPNPWWQVDLQGVYTLSEVRLYNRMDVPDRARTIQVLLSNDGNTWTQAYDNNGKSFGGCRGTDQAQWDPLRVTDAVRGRQTRFVRLQLAENTYFHLDAVEVYGTPGGSGPTTQPAIKTRQSSYSTSDNITVDYSGLPGNRQSWFGLASVGMPDAQYMTGYGDYATGNASDSRTFPALPAGQYEARAWIQGSDAQWTLRVRSSFTVSATAVSAGKFDGIWSTDLNIGLYIGLVQTGTQVQGYYYAPDGKWYPLLSGTVNGGVLRGTWNAGIPWFSGAFTFTQSTDGKSFRAAATGLDGIVAIDFNGQFYQDWSR